VCGRRPVRSPLTAQRSTGVVLCGHVRLCRLFAPRSALPRREGTVADPLPPVRRLATPLPTGSPALKKGKRGQGQIPAGSNKDHNMRITAFSSPLTCSSPPLSTPHRRVWNRSEHGVGRGGGEPAQSEGGSPLADAPPGRLSPSIFSFLVLPVPAKESQFRLGSCDLSRGLDGQAQAGPAPTLG